MIEKNDPRLTAYVLGELSVDETAEIESAIQASPGLKQAVEELETTTLAITNAFDNEPPLQVASPNKVSFINKEQITGSRTTSLNSNTIRWIAACSIMLLIGSISFLLMQTGPNGPALLASKSDPRDNTTTSGQGFGPAETTLGQENETIRQTNAERVARAMNIADLGSGLRSSQKTLVETEKSAKAFGPESANINFPDAQEWASKVEKRKKFQGIDLASEPLTENEIDTQNSLLTPGYIDSHIEEEYLAVGQSGILRTKGIATESWSLHDRRPADSVDLPLQNPNVAVDTFTFDGEASNQRVTDEELIAESSESENSGSIESDPDEIRVSNYSSNSRYVIPSKHSTNSDFPVKLLQDLFPNNIVVDEPDSTEMDIVGRFPGFDEFHGTRKVKTETPIRTSFQLDQQISNAKVQLQSAILRLGPTHPSVQSFRAQVAMMEEYQLKIRSKSNGATASQIQQRVLKRLRGGGKSAPRSWKRVKAINNTSRLLVGDKDELDLTGMQVHVQVDGFRARVLMDYFYYNDRVQQLEGNFKIRLPDDASLYYFAFGQSAYDFSPDEPMAGGEFVKGKGQYVSLRPADIGLARQDVWQNVKEARMVPREKAAFAYSQTVRRKVDPALVEWSGAGIFNARVFPLMPKKLHRIVIGYDVNLTATASGSTYRLDLPEQAGQCRVDLSVTDFQEGHWQLSFNKRAPSDSSNAGEAETSDVTEWQSNKVAGNGKSQKRMRFDDPYWNSLTLTAQNQKPVLLTSSATEQGDFFATQFNADLPTEKQTSNHSAVFMVDTSLSSRPEKFNLWLDLLKATLDRNRDDLKQFAVLFFDVDSRFWKTQYVQNTEANVKSLMHDCFQIGLEGATNLHGAMQELAEADWILENKNQPDVFLLSDGAANWGETNLRLIQREFVDAGIGSLFAYQTGLNGTAISNLRLLANTTGGAVFSVASNDEVARAATAHRNRPWRLESIEMEDAKDVMTAGRVEWIYPGQQLTIVGRGKTAGNMALNVSQGGQKRSIPISFLDTVDSEMASRLFGQVAVGQLESLGDSVFDISASYARHFRVTGKTCSLLMLESEADYQRFNIKPKEDWFVVQSKNAGELVKKELVRNATLLADPKAQLTGWIDRLESMPGLEFKLPTALQIALDDIQIEAIDARLNCETNDRENWSKEYTESLNRDSPDPAVIAKELERRLKNSPDEALKAYSNLIEANQGDWVIARDVAFKAMQLNRPAPAYHLFRQVIRQRPYDSSTYTAIAQCLGQLGHADMAIVFYEIALGAKFQNQGSDFKKIAATEYAALLRRISQGKLKCSVPEYVSARQDSLAKYQPATESDLLIAMMWNTDQTDVDLHVVEPSGEECSYENTSTKSGGKITVDIRNGFGPEMYLIPKAPNGEYSVHIKYFATDQNRTAVANKAYLTIYRNYGTANETVTRETVELKKVGQKELVKTITID